MIRNTTITDDVSLYLRRRNSIHRFNVRRIEKNRFPVKCGCVICGEGFLCRNIEQYIQRQYYLGPDKKGDIRHVCWGCDLTNKVKVAAATLYQLIDAIPVVERDREEIYPTDFRAPQIPLWRAEKMRLHGLGLRDYSEPTKLLDRFGRYEPVIRQKAASSVRDILAIGSVDLCGQLTPETTQA
jgi:hypothetical protein